MKQYPLKPWPTRLICLLGALPLVLKVPYVLRAWLSSPLDSFDIVFVPMAALAIVWAAAKLHGVPQYIEWKPLLLGVPLVAAGLFFQMRHVNVPVIFCSIAFWWFAWWAVRGWDYALRILPAFAILLPAVTQTTYWICYFGGVTPVMARVVKGVFVLLCLGLLYAMIEFGWKIRVRTLFGTLLLVLASLAGWEVQTHLASYQPMTPAFKPRSVMGYVGRESRYESPLFRLSKARNVRYADGKDVVSVLAVDVGADVHEIHPASYCLQSGGWRIEREQPTETEFMGRPFQVTEIEAVRNGVHVFVWVWYSNAERSTGSFIGFRRWATSTEGWHAYQISVPYEGNPEKARSILAHFLHHGT